MRKNWMKTHNKQFNQLDGIHRNYLNMIWEMGKTTIESNSLICLYPDFYTICDNCQLPIFIKVTGVKVQKVTIEDILE